tara:strand:+ start:359 stop:607 length:249 start_codon:yes stop_codon:yes gene_type:complete
MQMLGIGGEQNQDLSFITLRIMCISFCKDPSALIIGHKHRSQQVKINNCHEVLESVFGYYPIAYSSDLAKCYFLSVSGKNFA